MPLDVSTDGCCRVAGGCCVCGPKQYVQQGGGAGKTGDVSGEEMEGGPPCFFLFLLLPLLLSLCQRERGSVGEWTKDYQL